MERLNRFKLKQKVINMNNFSNEWLLLKRKVRDMQDKENNYINSARSPEMRTAHENRLETLFKVEQEIKDLEGIQVPPIISAQSAQGVGCAS